MSIKHHTDTDIEEPLTHLIMEINARGYSVHFRPNRKTFTLVADVNWRIGLYYLNQANLKPIRYRVKWENAKSTTHIHRGLWFILKRVEERANADL